MENRRLKQKLEQENINYDHIKNGSGYDPSKIHTFRKHVSLNDVLTLNSSYSPRLLKKRLIKEGLLFNYCNVCNIQPLWNNLPLQLQLDHINGNNRDNRLENLRLLCPNCHSQTDTFAAKNKIKKNKPTKIVQPRKTKITWPDDNELLDLVTNSNFVQVAATLGVSDNAIRKRLKRAGLIK